MHKIWITRTELRDILREEAGNKLTDDWVSMFPDDSDKPFTGQPRADPPKDMSAARKPDQKPGTMMYLREPRPTRNVDVDRGSNVTPASKVTNVPMIPGNKYERSRYVRGSVPPAKQPYTRNELESGIDVKKKRPGMMDMLRSLISRNEDPDRHDYTTKHIDPRTGIDTPPAHWSADRRSQFHLKHSRAFLDSFKKYKAEANDLGRQLDALNPDATDFKELNQRRDLQRRLDRVKHHMKRAYRLHQNHREAMLA